MDMKMSTCKTIYFSPFTNQESIFYDNMFFKLKTGCELEHSYLQSANLVLHYIICYVVFELSWVFLTLQLTRSSLNTT